ncbi:MAG: hypothetical protein SPK90_04610 [Bacteroidales bacterium]|nr:hypothetical protein [Bacteroidales bacterium]MDY6405712.1 hypothetical protein [Bacteroidales bacterium]
MKREYLLLLLLPLLGLLSCNNNNPEWKEEYKEATFYVIKFNPLAASYQPNVMLVPDSKGDYRMRKLSNGGTCREFIIGRYPFLQVDTVQNWYLADWKWGVILSMGHVAIPLRWVDVHNPDASYVRSDFEVAASGIIEKIGVVKRSDIDYFLHIEPAPAAESAGTWGRTSGGISTDHLAPVYLSRYFSVQDIPEVIDRKDNWEYTKRDFLEERLRQDSLQGVYRERLEKLIYAGMGDIVINTLH